MFKKTTFAGLAILVLLCSGCARGFKSADDLERDKRGPRECAASCAEFGMHMSAFVLFELYHSGCVCSPGEKAAPADDGATAVAAGHAVLMEQERRRREEAERARNATY